MKKKRKRRSSFTTYSCPHCGEEVDSSPDLGGGEVQSYIEDCPVCCRPNHIHAVLDPDTGEHSLSVTAEND
jgi:transcription elongation factor Elf1